MKHKILWVCQKGEEKWAYGINCSALIKALPKYEHTGFCMSEKEMDEADIIAVMQPALIKFAQNHFGKTLAILDTVRSLQGKHIELLAKVRWVIVTNEELFDAVRKVNSNVILQPNGLDLNFYSSSNSVRKKFTVGFAANVSTQEYSYYKGFPFYMEAVRQAKVSHIKCLFGSNQISPQDMIKEFYHRIDCLVLLSKNEGCSNVIAEALSCGVPVICTKVGYHGDVCINNQECIFVDRNTNSVREAIQKLSKDKDLQQYMKKMARDFACQHHDIISVAKTYSRIFMKIAKTK